MTASRKRCLACGSELTDSIDGYCVPCADIHLTPERKREVIAMFDSLRKFMQMQRRRAKGKAK